MSWSVWMSAAVASRLIRAAASWSAAVDAAVDNSVATATSSAERDPSVEPPRAKASMPRARPSRAASPASSPSPSTLRATSSMASPASSRCALLPNARRPRFVANAPRTAGSLSRSTCAPSVGNASPGSRPKTACAIAVATAVLTTASGSSNIPPSCAIRPGSSSRPSARTAMARTAESSLSRCA